MTRFPQGLLHCAVGLLTVVIPAGADIAQLTISSQIQFSKVIQGGVDPIFGFVFNDAPVGSQAGNYNVTAAYGNGFSNGFGFFYTGTKIADGGATHVTLPFPLNTGNITPGNVPVQITLTNTGTGNSISQRGQFTVLAHGAPALILQGSIVSLSSKNVVTFQTDAFCQAPPSGTEGCGGGFTPQMVGDPPGEPTAALDLDSITSFGSPDITTTLTPFTDLPANDDPSQAFPFQIKILAPSPGDYSTTFLLHYSDEQDLPGARAPGSELASFTVNVDLTGTNADWTIATDTTPEPGYGALILAGCILCATARWRRGGYFR